MKFDCKFRLGLKRLINIISYILKNQTSSGIFFSVCYNSVYMRMMNIVCGLLRVHANVHACLKI